MDLSDLELTHWIAFGKSVAALYVLVHTYHFNYAYYFVFYYALFFKFHIKNWRSSTCSLCQRWFRRCYSHQKICQSRSWLWAASPRVDVIESSLNPRLTSPKISVSCLVGCLWFMVVIYVILKAISKVTYLYVKIPFHINTPLVSSGNYANWAKSSSSWINEVLATSNSSLIPNNILPLCNKWVALIFTQKHPKANVLQNNKNFQGVSW